MVSKMGIKIGNDWNPSGDYGTTFENELVDKASKIENIINDIKKEQQNIKNNNKNSEVSDTIVEILDGVLKKFENTRIYVKEASGNITKYYE